MQKFITHELLDEKGARYVTNVLWLLMENNLEEVKTLQTAALLLTTSNLVRGESLSKVSNHTLSFCQRQILFLIIDVDRSYHSIMLIGIFCMCVLCLIGCVLYNFYIWF